METNKNPFQQMLDSNLKQSEHLLNFWSRSFNDMFGRQLNLISDYANISNSYLKQASQAFPFNFFGSTDSATKEKDTKKDQTTASHAPDLHELAADQFARIEKEWPRLTHEYEKLLHERVGLITTAVQKTVDAYNRQLDLSKENGKNFIEEMNRQFFEVSKQYRALWLEFFALMGSDHIMTVKPATNDVSAKKQSKEVMSQ